MLKSRVQSPHTAKKEKKKKVRGSSEIHDPWSPTWQDYSGKVRWTNRKKIQKFAKNKASMNLS